MPNLPSDHSILEEGRRVLQLEADALSEAAARLDASFVQAVRLLAACRANGGKIVVSGIGKSGNVAKKLAATLTSTGSVAIFLHPTEALHGDLGLIGSKDIFLMLSHSGSTAEIVQIAPVVRSLCAHAIAILGNVEGALARHADIVIDARIPKEACPNNLAPTTSSTLQMAIGDALAMGLQQLTGFAPEGFAKLHPGGALGKRLHTRVQDLMHSGSAMAKLPPTASMEEVVIALTDFRLSGVCIMEQTQAASTLLGVITEGDLRRALFLKDKFFELSAQDIMTKNPVTVLPEILASEALQLMELRSQQLSFMPVVDAKGVCVGVVRLHDLVLAGLG